MGTSMIVIPALGRRRSGGNDNDNEDRTGERADAMIHVAPRKGSVDRNPEKTRTRTLHPHQTRRKCRQTPTGAMKKGFHAKNQGVRVEKP